MSLPQNSVMWPPPRLNRAEMLMWDNLYAGRLINGANWDLNVYNASSVNEKDKDKLRIHSGIVADIANASSALMLGKKVQFRFSANDSETIGLSEEQQKITNDECKALEDYTDTLLEDGGVYQRFLEGEELCSAIGGAYYMINANPDVMDLPYLNVYSPINFDPIFIDGKLVAGTCWSAVLEQGVQVWRLVESRDNRTKTIEVGLYLGTIVNLGTRQPIDSIPQTSGIKEFTVYPEGIDRMVWYIPNMFPNKRDSSSPHGRADIQGAESLILAHDNTYTSLFRDIRNGRSRIIVPNDALTNNGVGNGSTFDNEQEVFTSVNIPGDTPSNDIRLLQGNIRSKEHIDTALALFAKIVGLAGYSPQTFGLPQEGGTRSPSALNVYESEERRTIATIEGKRRYREYAMTDIVFNLLKLANHAFNYPIIARRPALIWPDIYQIDPLVNAQVIQILKNSGAISIETAVSMAQPDLSEADVIEEAERIAMELGIMLDAPLSGTLPLISTKEKMPEQMTTDGALDLGSASANLE